MNNTVLLVGKGWTTQILFLGLLDVYPEAKITNCPLRWWQNTPRYEMRIQNLPSDEIEALFYEVNSNWPLTSFVDVQVF